MPIHVRDIEVWRRMAAETQARPPDVTPPTCPTCAKLGAAVLALSAELERARSPYAAAFRDGATGALDFAARTFAAMGQPQEAALLRRMRAVVTR